MLPFSDTRLTRFIKGEISAADLTAIGNSTPDGFTGHEMLDGVGLIHMRGRVYDPTVGRFLSVDPIVRAVDASQSWNGYGYVEGRVASWTDPDGWSGRRLSTTGNVQPVNPPPPPPLPTGNITTRTTHHFYDIEIVFRTTGDFMRMSGGRGNAASFGSVNEAQEVDREPQVPSEDEEARAVVQPSATFQCAQSASSDADRVATPVGLAAAGSQFGVPGLVIGAGVGLLATTLKGGFNGDQFASNAIDGLGAVAMNRGNPIAFFGDQVGNYLRREIAEYPAFAIIGGSAASSVATSVIVTRGLTGAAAAARYGGLGGAAYLASFAFVYNYSYRSCMGAKSQSD